MVFRKFWVSCLQPAPQKINIRLSTDEAGNTLAERYEEESATKALLSAAIGNRNSPQKLARKSSFKVQQYLITKTYKYQLCDW